MEAITEGSRVGEFICVLELRKAALTSKKKTVK